MSHKLSTSLIVLILGLLSSPVYAQTESASKTPIRKEKPWLISFTGSVFKFGSINGLYHFDAKNAIGVNVGSILATHTVGVSYRNYHGLENNTSYHELHMAGSNVNVMGSATLGYEYLTESGLTLSGGLGVGGMYSSGPVLVPGTSNWGILPNADLSLGYRF